MAKNLKKHVEVPHEHRDLSEKNDSDHRRAVLKKLGRFGLYTAPAILVMFESTKAPAATG